MAIAAIAAPAMPASKPMPSVQPRRYRSNIDPRTRSEIESWNDAVDRRKAEKTTRTKNEYL
jgi:hypothetical protein